MAAFPPLVNGTGYRVSAAGAAHSRAPLALANSFVYRRNFVLFWLRLRLANSRASIMAAHFTPPDTQDNNDGWGPLGIPEQYKDLPYQPFSKVRTLPAVSPVYWTRVTTYYSRQGYLIRWNNDQELIGWQFLFKK